MSTQSAIRRRPPSVVRELSAALLALACAATPPATAAGQADQDDAFGIPPAVSEAFARRLQAALRQHDVSAVSALVAFPLRINGPGRQRRQLGRAQFVSQFDAVFTAAVTREVLAQDPADLFQRDQGVMFGSGAVWANRACPGGAVRAGCPVRVYAVNLPDQ